MSENKTEMLSPEKPITFKVKVYPYRKGVGYGNIMWEGKFPMRNGKFPKDHPCADGDGFKMEIGKGPGLVAFRERGYWASCFPEGDGITWEPLKGQSHDLCMIDIRECFGWDAQWGAKP
jgi:hypothetical protein